MSSATLLIKSTALHPFLAEVIRQVRLLDTAEIDKNLSDDSLLDRLLTPPDSNCQLWGDGDLDSLTKIRLRAFYGAVAAEVERETGKLVQLFLNLSRSGLSSVLISCGKLLVICDLIRQANCFGFESPEQLIKAGEQLTQTAISKTQVYFA